MSADVQHAIAAVYAGAVDLLERDRFGDAAELLRALVVLAPHDERGWMGLVAAHEALGQADVAERLARLAQPVTESARCALAEARLLRARGDEHASRDAAARAHTFASARGETDLVALAHEELAS